MSDVRRTMVKETLFRCGWLLATATVVSSQAKAIFSFDEDTLQPSGVVATVYGAEHTTAGYEGGAFEFRGAGFDDWIRVAFDGNPLTRSCPRFTMGAFVRVDSVPPDRVQSLLSADNGNFDRTLAIDFRGNGCWGGGKSYRFD